MNKQALLLHGWGTNSAVFSDFIPHLDGFYCNAIDMPGHGNANESDSFSLIQIADDIASKIKTPQHLLGWSLGGFVAILIAARHKDKVLSLTLCCSFARYTKSCDYPEGIDIHRWQKNVQAFENNYPNSVLDIFKSQSLTLPETMLDFEQLAKNVIAHKLPTLKVLQDSTDALINADARHLLPQITCPTLILVGTKDLITNPSMGNYLYQHLPNAKLHYFHKSAHMPFVSEKIECATLLKDFWSKLS
ncbi:MAG: alpha/beta fold hydrolase [Neisseriaceae bacterium]|nr:alpha/beta fold hydrolase [Neisseriaceae bacterium]